MANTLNLKGFTLEISNIDSDWLWNETFTHEKYARGLRINFIQFNPTAASDKCVIKEESDEGPQSFYVTAENANNQKRAYYYGTPMKPVLDFSAGTFTAGCTVIIQLWREVVH